MLEIKLKEISKRYQYEWIFRKLTFSMPPASKLAITGSNGSGKSTLLKCISGLIPLTEGSIDYFFGENKISESEIFKHLVISAPYLELPEEFNLLELLKFHFNFKKSVAELSYQDMVEIMYLKEHLRKPISQFSSGMKQRLKIGLCFFSDVPLVLLDEPTSNLDQNGVEWYLEMVNRFGGNRNIVVCSNEPKEYPFCDSIINVEDFKLKHSL